MSDSEQSFVVGTSPASSPPTSPLFGSSPLQSSPLRSSPLRSSSPTSSPPARYKYKRYNLDTSIRVPKTTVRRWQSEGIIIPLPENAGQSAADEKDASHVSEVGYDCDVSLHENVRPLATVEDANIVVNDIQYESEVGDHMSSTSSSDSVVSSVEAIQPDSSATSSDEENSSSSDDESVVGADYLHYGSLRTTDEAVFSVIDVFLRHKLSKQCLKSILNTIKFLLPQPNDMPSSVYNLFKYVQNVAPACDFKEHFYCQKCLKYQETSDIECDNCFIMASSVFYELSIVDQIRHLFEQRNLADILDANHGNIFSTSEDIKDIVSGSECRKIKFQHHGCYDLTLMWNTDGVAVSGSSKAQLWPLQFVICEVPPRLRASFILVCGIWFDHQKPAMNMFLKPFVEALQNIFSCNGVGWNHPRTGIEHTSMVIAPLVCADAPARAQLQYIKQYNSKYGCSTCEQKAVRVQPQHINAKVLRRFVYQEDPAKLRVGADMDKQGDEAERKTVASGKEVSVKGVKGKAEISGLPFLDRATCVYPEYLHSVLLGVMRHFLMLWFTVKGDWYIGRQINDIDALLSAITPPDFITRLPRGVSLVKYWKGNELRSFLLFYSLIILSQFLPPRYIQHWILLVNAIYILLQDTITKQDIEASKIMLRLFVRDVGHLYRYEDYTYNMHQLLHLSLSVERWGPLWATSAFLFENFNGVLSKLLHGSRHQGMELVNNLKVAHGFQVLRNKVKTAQNSPNACGEVTVLGKPIQIKRLRVNELAALADFNEYLVFGRATLQSSELFSSALYDEKMKRKNSYIKFLLQGEKRYGRIQCFIKDDSGIVYSLVYIFRVDHVNIFYHRQSMFRVTHLIPIVETNDVICIQVKHISAKLLRVGNFLCTRPNEVEWIM